MSIIGAKPVYRWYWFQSITFRMTHGVGFWKFKGWRDDRAGGE